MQHNSWVRLLAYVTGLVNQRLLLQCEYLAAENRILRSHLPRMSRSPISIGDHSLKSANFSAGSRDAKFCAAFDNVLTSEGIRCLKLPPRSPNSERLRRKVGALSQAGVPFQAHSVW
jgi:hypothetical protein